MRPDRPNPRFSEGSTNGPAQVLAQNLDVYGIVIDFAGAKRWRRGSESNRRIKVLQTSPLPLGYRAILNNCTARLERTRPGISATFRSLRLAPTQRPRFSSYRLRRNGFSLESSRESGNITAAAREKAAGGSEGSHLERETGLEPATLALARRCSTTELLPHTS